jgi:hypothetical protein
MSRNKGYNPLLGGPLVPPESWAPGEMQCEHVRRRDAEPCAQGTGCHGASGHKIQDRAQHYTVVHHGFFYQVLDPQHSKHFSHIWDAPAAVSAKMPKCSCSTWELWDHGGHQEVDKWQRETKEMDLQAQLLQHGKRGELQALEKEADRAMVRLL